VVAKSTALSAKNGLLIRNRTAFENSRKITSVVFDKTGTLTIGRFEVSRIISLKADIKEDEILKLASALEKNSEHPIATGILQKAKERLPNIPEAVNFIALTGQGVEAMVDGKKVQVVSPGYLKEKGIQMPEGFSTNDTETVVFVILDDVLDGLLVVAAADVEAKADAAITRAKKRAKGRVQADADAIKNEIDLAA
jgi:Cu2+-exporting ATPase